MITKKVFDTKRQDIESLFGMFEPDEFLTNIIKKGVDETLVVRDDYFDSEGCGHKTVELVSPFFTDPIKVDVGMKDIAEEVWRHNLCAVSFCENDVPINWMSITFSPSSDVDKFISLLLDGESTDSFLSKRIMGFKKDDKINWKYEYKCGDYDIINSGTVPETISFISLMTVRFHKADYRNVVKRLQKKK